MVTPGYEHVFVIRKVVYKCHSLLFIINMMFSDLDSKNYQMQVICKNTI